VNNKWIKAIAPGLIAALALVLVYHALVVSPIAAELGAEARGTVELRDRINAREGIDVTNGAAIDALTLEGVVSSGPVTFGSAASIVTGTTIAHGLGTTPTTVLLTAGQPVTTTPLVLAANTTSITVGFLNTHNPPAMTVYWLAGK
jgi:hypothetical protein